MGPQLNIQKELH